MGNINILILMRMATLREFLTTRDNCEQTKTHGFEAFKTKLVCITHDKLTLVKYKSHELLIQTI